MRACVRVWCIGVASMGGPCSTPLYKYIKSGIRIMEVIHRGFDGLDVAFEARIPAAKTDLDAFDLMRARVSCRSFQSRNLTPEHLAELLETARKESAPGNQLGTHPIRFEYIAAPLTVWPVVGGHEFLVAIAPAKYNRMSVIDIGRSLQKVIIHATRMGLSTCWIGPGADQNSVIHHLGDRYDPTQDHVICVCAVGYASKFRPIALRFMQKALRKRLPLETLFTSDPNSSVPMNSNLAPSDSYGRCYEVCQCFHLRLTTGKRPDARWSWRMGSRFGLISAQLPLLSITRLSPWGSGAPTGKWVVRRWIKKVT